jgi:cation diffusion facilitator family transporter
MTLGAARAEAAVLRHSLWLTVVIAAVGVVFGILSGSLAIIFDGVASSINAAMTFLSLAVARLLAREGSRRFQFGYWHFEPLALALNGALLVMFCFYGFVTGVSDLLAGGRDLDFGWAMAYAALSTVASLVTWLYERWRNRTIRSELIGLDMQSWLMATAVSAALLVAFGYALMVEGTALAWTAALADPAVLALVSLGLAFMPIAVLHQAWQDIFQMAPGSLDAAVEAAARRAVERHGLATFTSYVARAGRATFIEIHLVLPADYPIDSVATLDRIRREIAEELGPARPERWLTVAFTGDATLI